MKVQLYEDGGLGLRELQSPGMTMTGFLIPSNDLSDDAYLARKEYADSVFSSIDASQITTGTLSFDTIKTSLSGDIVVQGDGVVRIKGTIPTGTFTKVTVTDKGLVTMGSVLSDTDIPNLDWSKFTDKPTTAGGYGITDALLSTGGTVTGNITLAADPTTSTEAATKQYTDVTVSAATSGYIVTGDVLYKLTASTPTGFLRCNGGYVSRTTYSALYAVLGSSYNHPTDATLFSLPDLTTMESQGFGMFIKT